MTRLMVTNAVLAGEQVDLDVHDGVITAIAPHIEPGPDGADDVLDANGMAVVPGMVNGHGHAAMTLFRGYGSDLQLQEWLSQKIWPAEAMLTEEDCYWGTRLAALEMIRSGTTHFFDMYWQPAAVARAAEEAGIRATVGQPLFDGKDPAGLGALQEAALESLEQLESCGPLITPSLTPHAIYTVSRESLDWIGSLASERDLIIHIHLAETRRETDEWMDDPANAGQRAAFFLDERGCLGAKTLIAHGSFLDADELALVAQRGATIVTNPVSNLKLASGAVFPYPAAAELGVPIGLGTDGASSNNGLDLFDDMRIFALVQKHSAYDARIVPAATALEIAQGRHAPLLGGRPVEVGAPADFLLIDTSLPEMNPGDLIDNLVYSGTGAVVDSTVIAGRVVMRHHEVAGQTEVIAEARRCAARLRGGE